MTEHRAAPTTEAGRGLAAKAKQQAWGNWEGLMQFTIPAIEAEAYKRGLADAERPGWTNRRGSPIAEARAAARKEVLDEIRGKVLAIHPATPTEVFAILEVLSTDTREEPT